MIIAAVVVVIVIVWIFILNKNGNNGNPIVNPFPFTIDTAELLRPDEPTPIQLDIPLLQTSFGQTNIDFLNGLNTIRFGGFFVPIPTTPIVFKVSYVSNLPAPQTNNLIISSDVGVEVIEGTAPVPTVISPGITRYVYTFTDVNPGITYGFTMDFQSAAVTDRSISELKMGIF